MLTLRRQRRESIVIDDPLRGIAQQIVAVLKSCEAKLAAGAAELQDAKELRRDLERLLANEPDGAITITVLDFSDRNVRLGITAPRSIAVDRHEVYVERKRKRQSGG